MAYLHYANGQHPVFVLAVQEQLLAWHQQGNHGLATGISAMPSVHIAQATLVALIAWTSRWWFFRALGLLFLIVLQLSTVALGWHYAIDGYVAACLTWIFWRLSAPSGTKGLPSKAS